MKPHSKVVWCVDSPGWGGSEINLLRVWALANRQNDDVLLNATVAPELVAAVAARKFTVLRHTSPNAATSMLPGLTKALWLTLRFWRHQFVIWAHHSDSNRWLQVTLTVTRRNFIIVEQLVPASPSVFARSRLSLPLKRFVARQARHVVLNAHSQEQHYRQMFNVPNARIRIIPNTRSIAGLGKRAIELRRERATLRKRLGLPSGPLVICVGRLCGQKDQAALVKALAMLNSQAKPPASLVLVGDGEDAGTLETLANQIAPGQVTFAGHRDDPLPWLAAADVFVLPSLTEGLPGALIEAMAAGLPCVATDIPGNRELVRHEQTGLLVPPQNSAALAGAIRTLLEDPSKAQQLAEAGYNHVIKNYDESIEASLWRKLFVR